MKEISLTKGYSALIDDEDYARVSQWSWYAKEVLRKDGSVGRVYAKRRKWEGRTKPNGDLQSLHRFLLGIDDPHVKIDHRNGNGLDCQKHNLRVATNAQNLRNRSKRVDGLSVYKGVGRWKNNSGYSYWRTRISIDGKNLHRLFDRELRAAVEYDWLALCHHKEFARTNFALCPLNFLAEDTKTTP